MLDNARTVAKVAATLAKGGNYAHIVVIIDRCAAIEHRATNAGPAKTRFGEESRDH
jgi:hypothetical protein